MNQMIRDIQNLWLEANRTIVMIMHGVSEAVLMADRVLVLSSRPSEVIADVSIKLPHPREQRDPEPTTVRRRDQRGPLR
jgi:NitT/TauT family transport system ATP-binding protein